MKVAILAGGLGSRLSEETVDRPKPMVRIGQKPILWHIIKIYEHYGLDEFVVALGYKGDYIKRWMSEQAALTSDVTMDMRTGTVGAHPDSPRDEWRVSLIETGEETGTGGRIKRLGPHLGDGTFCVTYGDGVANVNIAELLAFHRRHGKLCTLTAVHPPARFGHLKLDGARIVEVSDKPQTDEGWINGAFFVCEPEVLDYIERDDVMFEQDPLERLAKDGQLMAFRHEGFWQCMDTMRDKALLERLWKSEQAPWKVWR